MWTWAAASPAAVSPERPHLALDTLEAQTPPSPPVSTLARDAPVLWVCGTRGLGLRGQRGFGRLPWYPSGSCTSRTKPEVETPPALRPVGLAPPLPSWHPRSSESGLGRGDGGRCVGASHSPFAEVTGSHGAPRAPTVQPVTQAAAGRLPVFVTRSLLFLVSSSFNK